jgi:apolipoprotein N-acyltransferase
MRREAGRLIRAQPAIKPKIEPKADVQSFANAIVVLWGWRRLAVACIAGAVSALAFAPFYAVPVLWVTIPVFVWLIDGAEPDDEDPAWRRLLPAASVGFAFGFGFFLAGLWWIGAAFLVDADMFAWALPFAVAGLPALLALFWAVAAAAARLFWRDGWSRILVFAVALSAAEWLRGHLFTGFPWNAFGYALTPAPVFMQSAALVGVWGLTLAAFIVFAVPVVLVGESPPVRRRVIVAGAVLLVAHVGFGLVRLAAGPDPLVAGVHLRIVQPDIPQDERWASEKSAESMARYLELSRSGPSGQKDGLAGITHVIWPESAFPFLLTRHPEALAAIADLLPPGTTLITGAARGERLPDGHQLVFNSIYAIDDGGEIRAAYDKVHLVPFGEYVPFRGILEWLGVRQLIALPGGFSAGDRLHTLAIPGAPPAGPLICYEVIFPGAVVDPADRPAWLVNVTNDGWYGNTPGPYQHLLQARVRAVEEGLPLVRAANTGISAIVDPHGRIVASLALGRIGIVDGGLPAALSPTLYAHFGDLVFLAMLCVAAVGAAAASLFGRRRGVANAREG